MSFHRSRRVHGGILRKDYCSWFSTQTYNNNINHSSNHNNPHDFSRKSRERISNVSYDWAGGAPSLKRRKFSASAWEDSKRHYQQTNTYTNGPSTSNSSFPAPTKPETSACTFTSCKRDRSKLEDDMVFMSRDEIERCSPSRKDGIDSLGETYLRYSYCAFLQNLGLRLELPQTTIGTAMILCHRFFVRQSHAGHDRFLIATAALFLGAKYEETPRPLNDLLRTSSDICHKQDHAFFSYLLPVDWFEQYRERVLEAEQMILTTLDFELSVQHPYVPLTSVLNKLGLSQTVLVNLALNLVSEGTKACMSAYLSMSHYGEEDTNKHFEESYFCNALQLPNMFPVELPIYWILNAPEAELGLGADKILGKYSTLVAAFLVDVEIYHVGMYKTLPVHIIAAADDWLRSSLWLQFKPHQIAAGAAYLAAKFLDFDLAYYQSMWQEFQTTPSILQDVVQQLMELF
ncbi:hypothetical protein HHK36_026698 [Tetracentron sinense]|uniref:Cyclin-like domain-containing protein n=1 Tax=Tetracentron sinense TaxID=13715 RepID=A0A834YFZ6_TETSI|nr:hypothetical protein HHK36_026698 [Tetracentron sinense]